MADRVGLTTSDALRQLKHTLDVELAGWKSRLDDGYSLRRLVLSTLRHRDARNLHCGTFFVIQTAMSVAIFVSGCVQQSWQLTLAGIFVAAISAFNLLLPCRMAQLRRNELYRKAVAVVRQLDVFIESEEWQSWDAVGAYADLYVPASECISLQWTHRDGRLVNLPWILLVHGDVIELRPGREVPCRCRTSEG